MVTETRSEWQKVNGTRATNIPRETNWSIPLLNRFDGMPVDEYVREDDNTPETHFQRNVSTIKKAVINKINSNKGKHFERKT